REGELVPGVRQPGREGQPAVVVADAAEPEDERGPYAGGGGDVDSVRDVAGHVAQVHQQRVLEVLQGLALVADFGGDDALHACRQGRVAGGERVVVVEVAAFLFLGELVAEQEHGQHD